ncbi:hypothetical protein VNO77_04379 [Canavalia gladiata]|uniref:Symplekin C-terminal domain-containing protein n=1 Tax=Canavalia gladiata TaxID=3824 RepID=A0AAN9R907_CANGL
MSSNLPRYVQKKRRHLEHLDFLGPDACNVCFAHKQTFTTEVIAKVLNQLVEQISPPLLFMYTILQAMVLSQN